MHAYKQSETFVPVGGGAGAGAGAGGVGVGGEGDPGITLIIMVELNKLGGDSGP